MVFGVVLKLFSESNLGSLSVFEFVGEGWGGGNKISKIRGEGLVDVGDEYIRAEAGGWSAGRVISVIDEGSKRLQRIELMHPSGRFGMLVCENVCDLSVGVLRNS